MNDETECPLCHAQVDIVPGSVGSMIPQGRGLVELDKIQHDAFVDGFETAVNHVHSLIKEGVDPLVAIARARRIANQLYGEME